MQRALRLPSGKFRLLKMTCFVFTLCTATAINSPAQTLTTLHNFAGQPSDGSDSYSWLVQGSDGNFYGTTQNGGSHNNHGTVFKMTPSGSVTILHNFAGYPNNDGADPIAGLILARDGNFYGTTYSGQGNGDVFKITPGGTLTNLNFFNGQGGPELPYAGVIQGSDGNFYGTSEAGGIRNGTVYKMTPSGTVTNLYQFACTSACQPEASLVQGSDGNFYGTTRDGGINSNCGTVFKTTSSGNLTFLHTFVGTDGCEPYAALIQGSDGNFYGTTTSSGAHSGGTIFKITPSGALTTLYNFCSQSGCADGESPYGALVQASDGNFYGTTYVGGANRVGTIFQITPQGTLTTLHSFNGGDGAGPEAGLIQTSDGSFYGTTSTGGTSGHGTIFKFQVTYFTLTVSPTGDGVVTSTDGFINCPGTCSHSYLDNSQVTLNATPAAGWAFSGWGGACSGTGSCQVTITQNTNVSASFYQLPVTLTVSVAGSGSVTSTDGFINCPGTCMHTYDPGTPVTLNASPASGWAFSGWTGACSGVGTCNLTMTDNLAVTAVFVEPGHGAKFIAATPCRLVDTRQGSPIQGGTSQSFTVPQLGGCNIPATATAYSLNVTVIPHRPLNYLTIWPTGEAQPVVSTMNSPDGRVKANAAIVPAGTNGAVSVFVTDTSDVILDIDGYFAATGSQPLQFYPLTPCRVVDTRTGSNQPQGLGPPSLHDMETRQLPILNTTCPGLPASPAAYSFNVTVVPYPAGQPENYVTLWPSNEQQPGVSTLNNYTATVVANAAIVPAASDGSIKVFAYNSTDLLIDINGYFAAPGQGGYSFYPAAPCRAYDSRNNNGQPFRGERMVNIVSSPCAPPSNAKGYVFNATVVPTNGPMGYLTLWPDSEDQPVVSTLNAYDGFITSNMAIVPNVNGSIDAYADGMTHLILDISGYFAP